MDKDEQSRLPRTSILSNHSRDKKRLIPPILGLTGMRMVSTIDSIVPEIIWIGVLLDHYGLRPGIELASDFLCQLWQNDIEKDWFRFSEIVKNAESVSTSVDQKTIQKIKTPFAALKSVYDVPELQWVDTLDEISNYVGRIESAVRIYSNRFERPYLTMLATVVYAMGLSGKAHFAPGTAPNIEAIVTMWGTDEANLAAAELRAFSMAFFPYDQGEASQEWCRTFWRVNYRISGCDL